MVSFEHSAQTGEVMDLEHERDDHDRRRDAPPGLVDLMSISRADADEWFRVYHDAKGTSKEKREDEWALYENLWDQAQRTKAKRAAYDQAVAEATKDLSSSEREALLRPLAGRY